MILLVIKPSSSPLIPKNRHDFHVTKIIEATSLYLISFPSTFCPESQTPTKVRALKTPSGALWHPALLSNVHVSWALSSLRLKPTYSVIISLPSKSPQSLVSSGISYSCCLLFHSQNCFSRIFHTTKTVQSFALCKIIVTLLFLIQRFYTTFGDCFTSF